MHFPSSLLVTSSLALAGQTASASHAPYYPPPPSDYAHVKYGYSRAFGHKDAGYYGYEEKKGVEHKYIPYRHGVPEPVYHPAKPLPHAAPVAPVVVKPHTPTPVPVKSLAPVPHVGPAAKKAPVYHGYVPVHTKDAHRDEIHGFAIGHDAVGDFHHHTGHYGPFGFYANFYHD